MAEALVTDWLGHAILIMLLSGLVYTSAATAAAGRAMSEGGLGTGLYIVAGHLRMGFANSMA